MNTPLEQNRRQCRPFTLIELLVVVAIIAILMGLLFPAIGTVRRNAKITKARADMKALVVAVKSYEATYGLLPWGVNWTNNPTGSYNANYDTLTEFLTKVTFTAGAGSGPGQGNYRNVVFLEAPADFANKGYVDPWGNRYVLLMDVVTDGSDDPYDNQVTLKETVTTGMKAYANGDTLNGSVFVYSQGKPSEGVKAVASWE